MQIRAAALQMPSCRTALRAGIMQDLLSSNQYIIKLWPANLGERILCYTERKESCCRSGGGKEAAMSHRKIISCIQALLLCVLLSACAGTPAAETPAPQSVSQDLVSAASESDETRAGVFYYSFSDTYLAEVRTRLDIALHDAGISFVNYDAASSQAVQNTQIQTALESGINLLIVNIVSSGNVDATMEIIEKASARDIPVIFFNKPIEEEGEEGSILGVYDNIAFVGTDAPQAGHMQGEMIGSYALSHYEEIDLNGDGVISYALFKGEALNPEAIYRTRYAVEDANAILQEAGYPPMQYFDPSNYDQFQLDLAGTWSDSSARRYMNANLETYNTANGNMIELIICNNDNMAEGVIISLNAAGYNTGVPGSVTVPVFGIDATEYARQLIASGRMAGTIEQDSRRMAEIITRLAMNVAGGLDLMEGTDDCPKDEVHGLYNKIIIPYSFYETGK